MEKVVSYFLIRKPSTTVQRGSGEREVVYLDGIPSTSMS